eukprot:TRINITY_DN36416_c0_g2_i1.p1 TRINITY_DN36416_c0_g2~~TRINITY_DN36416_c0_g2_i1.p1  ORF type:complete len:595 (+),score=184.41 TRINITY_DN36416_c0_g2_i1:85-1869(+)
MAAAVHAAAAKCQAAGSALQGAKAEVLRLEKKLHVELKTSLQEANVLCEGLRKRQDALLAELERLGAARSQALEGIGSISKRQLAEVKQLTRSPPDSVRRTVVALYLLLRCDKFKGPKAVVKFDDNKDWPLCQKALADDSFINKVSGFDIGCLDSSPQVPLHIGTQIFGLLSGGQTPSKPSTPTGKSEKTDFLASGELSASRKLEALKAPSPPALSRANSAVRSSLNFKKGSSLYAAAAQVVGVKKFLDVEAVAYASAPCGALAKWVLEVVREHLARTRLLAELQRLEEELAEAEARKAELELQAAEADEALLRAQTALQAQEAAAAAAAKKVAEEKKSKPPDAASSPAEKLKHGRKSFRKETGPEIVVGHTDTSHHVEQQLSALQIKYRPGHVVGDLSQIVAMKKLMGIMAEHGHPPLKVLLEGHCDNGEKEGTCFERARGVYTLMVEKLGAPTGQFRVAGKGSSQGMGRVVVPVPIQEVVAEKGPLPPDVSQAGRPGLYFESNKSDMTEMTAAIMREMGRWLSTEEDEVRIEGHCDDTEKDSIAHQRSVVVKNALIAAGVSPTRLRLVNCGWQHPISASQVACNRRVELHLE